MQITVGDGVEGAGLGQLDLCFQNGLGEDIGAVGAEVGAGQFDRQLRAFGYIVERDPGDVMLKRYALAPWSMQPNTSPWRPFATTCAVLGPCLC